MNSLKEAVPGAFRLTLRLWWYERRAYQNSSWSLDGLGRGTVVLDQGMDFERVEVGTSAERISTSLLDGGEDLLE